MSQVVRTTNQLIINSLYLIGELGVGETPDSAMLETGIDLLNEILDKFSADGIYIPYTTTINATLQAGKDTYSVSDMITTPDITSNRIIDLVFASYTITSGDNNTSNPIRILSEGEYYNLIRQTTLQTRPGGIFLNNQPNQSLLIIYPTPDQAYPLSVQARCMLNQLGAGDTLNSLPPNAYGLLKYALGRKFLAYYPSANWPASNEKEYEDYYSTFKSTNKIDLTIRPSSILTISQPISSANILSY